MQVHAVPDYERAYDSAGRKLPWAFEHADSEHSQRRMPDEKGPFGRARKRGMSRSKTPNAGKEDEARLDNFKAIDTLFTSYKADADRQRSLRRSRVGSQAPVSASAPNLLDAAGLSKSVQSDAPTNTPSKEPKEVILYGFGSEVQWAAISHFERVSGGVIYEGYERDPKDTKFGMHFSQQGSQYGTLSRTAIAKVNEFVGGDHWIKVTFDSAEAAERACHYSPHVIQGYTVYAEPYRGTGPTAGDIAVRATVGALVSTTASPNTVSSTTIPFGASQSSATMSSATATTPNPSMIPQRLTSEAFRTKNGAFPIDEQAIVPSYQSLAPQSSQSPDNALAQTTASSRSRQQQPQRRAATLRIKSAKPVVFLPQEKAFLPAPPKWQQTLSSFPLIGWAIGSGHGIIGDQVPRKEDGTFDNVSASLYWRTWYAVDSCFGTDFCGVKAEEYDE